MVSVCPPTVQEPAEIFDMNTVCTCAIFLHEVDKPGHHILVHQGLANVYLQGGISGSIVLDNFQVHMHCPSVQAIRQRSRTFDDFFPECEVFVKGTVP